jgi:hypothetical protein
VDNLFGQRFDLVATHQRPQLTAQSVGQVAAFAQQFQADVGYDAFFLLDENPYVS